LVEKRLPDSAISLVEAGWVIPVTPAGAVLKDHAVVISSGVIRDVLPARLARERYPGAPRVELPGQALIPGLVNLHTHAAMALMRGLADDRAIMDWLRNHN